MAGQRQSKTRRVQDEHMIYHAATLELADALDLEHGVILYWWSQISLAREDCGEPRDLAEFMALQNVIAIFNCDGQEPN